jgi:hypothetical protein
MSTIAFNVMHSLVVVTEGPQISIQMVIYGVIQLFFFVVYKLF